MIGTSMSRSRSLRALFDDAVLQPIRLHVDAKRYLCARGHTA